MNHVPRNTDNINTNNDANNDNTKGQFMITHSL